MNKRDYIFLGFCLWMLLMGLQSCKKDKSNFEADNRAVTASRPSSTARIVNIASYGQVVANGDTLTSFLVRNPNSPDNYQIPGTDYFPVNGTLGRTWSIPQDLFNTAGRLELNLATRNYQGLGDQDLKFQVVNDNNNPTDYYIMPTAWMNGQRDVVAVRRDVITPSKPDHFKIRIVNLSGEIKNKGFNASGNLEDLTGNVSLAYADGSLVDMQTSNISNVQKTSAYVELPYGTYQFKVLMQDGRQMPALGSEQAELTVIDPATSALTDHISNTSKLTYAAIQTYQPGGIYTIVVAPQRFKFLINELSETSDTYQNSFQVINDNSAPVNNTFFRIQGVNAWNNENVSFYTGGTAFSDQVAFGKSGSYSALIQGSYTIEARDASGHVIATASQVLRPAQNYSAWLYPDENGAAKLLIVANDLSGATSAATPQDDATYARNQYKFFFFKRFLNLSAGTPYVTFTKGNGQADGGNGENIRAAVNLQPGIPVMERPYLSTSFTSAAYQIMAFRSKPNVVPGIWANDIEVLKSDAFIADKGLYQKAGRALPVQEAGIYTVALVGRNTPATPATKLKMIIIKHNK